MIIEGGRNRGKAYEADLRHHFLELKVRRTGRTTRLVDGYIQKLYRKLGEWGWRMRVVGRFKDIGKDIGLLRFEFREVWSFVYARLWGQFFVNNKKR